MSRALLDSLELPHWLILAGILLLIAGVIGLVINRKALQKKSTFQMKTVSRAPIARPSRPPAAKRTASGRSRPRDEGDARMTERPQKITFGEMRESGVVLVYCPMIFAGNPR
jgi:hypothetical protein